MPPMLPAVVGADLRLFALEQELIAAGEREDAAWEVFHEAQRIEAAWERKFPRPEYDREEHRATRWSDVYLREFSERRKDWQRRRKIVQERCDLERAAAYAKAHAEEVRRISERMEAIPATSVAGLKCKARCEHYSDGMADSVIRDLLAWEVA